MATDREYSWLSAAAYTAATETPNRIVRPISWDVLQTVDGLRSPNGFGATAFRQTQSGEVVIAFEGTNASGGLLVPLLAGDESDESTCERGADVWFAGASTSSRRFAADRVGRVE